MANAENADRPKSKKEGERLRAGSQGTRVIPSFVRPLKEGSLPRLPVRVNRYYRPTGQAGKEGEVKVTALV